MNGAVDKSDGKRPVAGASGLEVKLLIKACGLRNSGTATGGTTIYAVGAPIIGSFSKGIILTAVLTLIDPVPVKLLRTSETVLVTVLTVLVRPSVAVFTVFDTVLRVFETLLVRPSVAVLRVFETVLRTESSGRPRLTVGSTLTVGRVVDGATVPVERRLPKSRDGSATLTDGRTIEGSTLRAVDGLTDTDPIVGRLTLIPVTGLTTGDTVTGT